MCIDNLSRLNGRDSLCADERWRDVDEVMTYVLPV